MFLKRSVAGAACTLIALTLVAGGFSASEAGAAGLNTDVALTPRKGGMIVRAQWRRNITEGADTTTELFTVVYGLRSDLVLLGTVPFVDRGSTSGIGDVTLILKHRFYRDDGPLRTTRWAVLGGVEAPSYENGISSESLDVILGAVWTHQRPGLWLDWDVVYKMNTSGGRAGDDVLRTDLAYSREIAGGIRNSGEPWAFYLLGELNGKYITDSSTQLFFSPGIQYMSSRWVFEAGVQLPVFQDMAPPRAESDYTLVVSTRFVF